MKTGEGEPDGQFLIEDLQPQDPVCRMQQVHFACLLQLGSSIQSFRSGPWDGWFIWETCGLVSKGLLQGIKMTIHYRGVRPAVNKSVADAIIVDIIENILKQIIVPILCILGVMSKTKIEGFDLGQQTLCLKAVFVGDGIIISIGRELIRVDHKEPLIVQDVFDYGYVELE